MLDLLSSGQNLVREASPAFLPVAVFLAGILGTPHCVSMCGGLVTAIAPHPRENLFYQGGRLLGYLILGALAGLLGNTVLSQVSLHGGFFSWLAMGSIASIFIWTGIRVFMGKPLHFLPKSKKLNFLGPIRRALSVRNSPVLRASLVGGASVFLPCGWLYTFVLAAVSTAHPLWGAITLFSFWLGTLPGLVLAPSLVNRWLKPVALRSPRITGSILLVAGFATLFIKLSPLWGSGHTCH